MASADQIRAIRELQRDNPGVTFGQAKRVLGQTNLAQENLNALFAEVAALKTERDAMKAQITKLEAVIAGFRVSGDGGITVDGQGPTNIRIHGGGAGVGAGAAGSTYSAYVIDSDGSVVLKTFFVQ